MKIRPIVKLDSECTVDDTYYMMLGYYTLGRTVTIQSILGEYWLCEEVKEHEDPEWSGRLAQGGGFRARRGQKP